MTDAERARDRRERGASGPPLPSAGWFFGCDPIDGHHEVCTEFAGYANGKPGCACLAEMLTKRDTALLSETRATERQNCIEWVRAFARDCGCSERIEKAIREESR